MKKLILLFTAILIINGCSSDDTSTTQQEQEQENTEVKENVVTILDNSSNVISSESDLANGIYIVEFTGSVPEIVANDVIVGDEGNGYLRRVSSVSVSGNTLTMQTTQGTMEDVFNEASIEFTTDISESLNNSTNRNQKINVNYLAEGVRVSGDGLTIDFSNTVIYQDGPLTFKITDGQATFNPNFSFKSDYSFPAGLTFLEFKTENANLSIDADLLLNATSAITPIEFTKDLIQYTVPPITIPVAGIPIRVVVDVSLEAVLTASLDSEVNITTGFTNNYSLSAGIKYENSNWTPNLNPASPILAPKPLNIEGQVNLAQNLTIVPKVSVKFFNVIGPYCEPKMTEDFTYNKAFPSLNWDSELKAGLDITTGVEIEIFSFNKPLFSFPINYEETIWNAPDSIVMDESTNNQTGEQGQQLAEPLKVKVKDNLDNTLSNVPVHFVVTQGGGTIDSESVMTDENGFAEVYWTLGDNTDPQTVEVSVKKADGTNIESIATFNAIVEGSVIDNTFLIPFVWVSGEIGGVPIEFFIDNSLNFHNYNDFCENQPSIFTCSSNYTFDGINLTWTHTYNHDATPPDIDTTTVHSFSGEYNSSTDQFHGSMTKTVNGVVDETYPNTIISRL